MPRPLPSPDTPDGAFLGAMAEDPLNVSNTRLQYADWAKERGQPSGDFYADIEELRGRLAEAGLPMQVARPDQLALLRGAALTEEECAAVAADVRSLLDQPANRLTAAHAQTLEARLSSSLGSPQRAGETLDPLDPEQLTSQYDFQRTLLASLDLLEEQDNHLGINGVDGRFHLFPSLEAIHARLQDPALQQKVAQGFDQLLLVPFALPLLRFLDAWRRGLVRDQHLLQPQGGLHREAPLWAWEGYDRGELVYFPQRFATDHGGQTKEQLLAADPASGWQVLLTEGSLIDLPGAGQGQDLAGRWQVETDDAPRQYLESFRGSKEVGWTPEVYSTAFLTSLERTGRVLDTQTETYLIASYLPASASVPTASWRRRLSRAFLGRFQSDIDYPGGGARAAVRVL